MRLISYIVVMLLATAWLTSCGQKETDAEFLDRMRTSETQGCAEGVAKQSALSVTEAKAICGCGFNKLIDSMGVTALRAAEQSRDKTVLKENLTPLMHQCMVEETAKIKEPSEKMKKARSTPTNLPNLNSDVQARADYIRSIRGKHLSDCKKQITQNPAMLKEDGHAICECGMEAIIERGDLNAMRDADVRKDIQTLMNLISPFINECVEQVMTEQ